MIVGAIMNKEYYKNKKLPNVLISKDGDFVYESTKEKVYITKDNKPRLHVKVGKGYFYGNAARMVLETFNPIEDMNKFIVSYKDGNSKNIITKNIYIFSSLAHAADYLKLNLNTIRLSRSRKGPEFPINNWLFGSLNNLPMSKKLKGHKR